MSRAERAAVTARQVAIHRALAGVRRRPRRIPRQRMPRTIEREYARAIIGLVRAALERAIAPIRDELPALVEAVARERRDAARTDGDESRRMRVLVETMRREISNSITTQEIERLARAFAARTSSTQRVELQRQTRAAWGVDVLATDARIPPLMTAFVDANVGLIKNIPDAVAARVESLAMHAVQTGQLPKSFAKDLESQIGFGERRARLIARDQIGKFAGQLNAARQAELGVRRFVWRTVGDERVRDEHEERNGQIYEWADPPDGEIPGEPIQCRCSAEPVLDDLLDDL